MKFYCDSCGLCCKQIKHIKELGKFDRGDGVCVHLSSSNLCKIYDTRPDICNIEVMYEKVYKDIYSLDEFYKKNFEACLYLKNIIKDIHM